MKMEIMTEAQFVIFSKRYNISSHTIPDQVPAYDDLSNEPCYRYCQACCKLDANDSCLLMFLMSRSGHARRSDVVHDYLRLNSKTTQASKKRKTEL